MPANQDLLEKVETFQNLLISYATGGQVTDAEFRSLRDELLENPNLSGSLPRFVRTCRDLKQFWGFIKKKSETYQGRREFLWGEFGPILQALEATAESPADGRVSEAIGARNSTRFTKLGETRCSDAWTILMALSRRRGH